MKKGTLTNILLTIVLLVGLSLLLYPSFSEWWNSSRQTQVITQYAEAVANMDNEEYVAVLDAAREYNESLVTRYNGYTLEGDQKERYPQELNYFGDGLMGYVEIPTINVMLPIYHGTNEQILQTAIGHLEWSSLPVGGESSHSVISGHRGLPSARLFTDLDQLVVGDVFVIHVLNQVMTYQVDKIEIVLPENVEGLLIHPGEDYVTLVTCTPYGVNTHRLLVRGTRIANAEETRVLRVTADAIQIEPLVVAPMLAAPLLLILLIGILIPHPKKKKEE
jgi:sortase A